MPPRAEALLSGRDLPRELRQENRVVKGVDQRMVQDPLPNIPSVPDLVPPESTREQAWARSGVL